MTAPLTMLLAVAHQVVVLPPPLEPGGRGPRVTRRAASWRRANLASSGCGGRCHPTGRIVLVSAGR